jgi:23S rRNA (guanosine2251-2'-O)-methyltransferase
MRISLIIHDIRSCHNVGSLLRTAEGLGVQHLYLTGYTPYPVTENDPRLPHIRQKITAQIHKTALGAEDTVAWSHYEDIHEVIRIVRAQNYKVIALEDTHSISLPEYKSDDNIALLLGREVEGIEPELLALCDATIEIPMFGSKESFNVVQAAAMALYHCRFIA